jgi:hypothetical protein
MMAFYSYKQVIHRLPAWVREAFIAENGHEDDGDAGYAGDYWVLASMWIDGLLTSEAEKVARIAEVEAERDRWIARNAELERRLANVRRAAEGHGVDPHVCDVCACDRPTLAMCDACSDAGPVIAPEDAALVTLEVGGDMGAYERVGAALRAHAQKAGA